MAPTLESFEPADYAVIGASGLTAALAVLAAAYTVPWRCCMRASSGGAGCGGSPAKQAFTREFNVLWHGRAVLSLLSAVWALSLLLRVSSLWGVNSLFLPAGVAAWTGAGWMCRIYLTASLGFFHPLCAFTTLLMLKAALSRKHRPDMLRHPNARLLGCALLCTLPVAAVQSVIAWLGLVVQSGGQKVEATPRSVLGYFFAAYWQGTPEQCGGVGAAGAAPAGQGGCTLCVFPAAAAIAHALFAAAMLVALGVASARLASAVLNQRLRRRMRVFQAAYTLLTLLGVGAVGASVAWGPFTWANQACWLVLVACSLLTVLLVAWEVVVWPVRDLRAVDKRLVLWADAFAAAATEEAFDTRSSGNSSQAGYGGTGTSSLIKAHGRSAEGEAIVHAAAAARTLSVSAGPPSGKQFAPPAVQLPLPQLPQLAQPSPRFPPLGQQKPDRRPPLLQPPLQPPRTLSMGSAGGSPLLPVGWSPRRPAPAYPVLGLPRQPPQAQQEAQAAPLYTPATATKPTFARELLFP